MHNIHSDVLDRPVPVGAAAKALNVLPGLLASTGLAVFATAFHLLPGLSLISPMIVAVVAGMALNAFGFVTPNMRGGVAFATRPVLRLAIVLLAFQLTLTQIRDVGLAGTAIVALSLITTFVLTQAVGRAMGIDRKLVQLIAAGTSICGASAIVAINSVTRADDEDVAYALACVTLCGTIAMFAFPLFIHIADLDSYHYGLWTGAAIHEVGQVVAAAFQGGQVAGEFGTIAKLTRVLMLVPLIFVLAMASRRSVTEPAIASRPGPPVPVFIVLFLVIVCMNSVITVPTEMRSIIAAVATLFLTIALGAVGLATNVRKLRERGLKPLTLGTGASVFIALLSLVLLKLMA